MGTKEGQSWLKTKAGWEWLKQKREDEREEMKEKKEAEKEKKREENEPGAALRKFNAWFKTEVGRLRQSHAHLSNKEASDAARWSWKVYAGEHVKMLAVAARGAALPYETNARARAHTHTHTARGAALP